MIAKVTVVSAYYPIPSKFDPQTYLKWIELFWPHSDCALVWFTVPGLIGMFERLFANRPGPTKVLGLRVEDFTAFQSMNPAIWAIASEKDPEKEVKHTPELYAIWYEKKEFVRRVIELNPFQSEKFVWCDAGIVRRPEWVSALKGQFPIPAHIPEGKMLLLQLNPFHDTDYMRAPDGILGEDIGKRVTVGGGILASDREGWAKWSKAYDKMFMKYVTRGRFFGKDQNIFASMVLEDPGLAVRIASPPLLNNIDRWFYLLLFLSGVAVLQS